MAESRTPPPSVAHRPGLAVGRGADSFLLPLFSLSVLILLTPHEPRPAVEQPPAAIPWRVGSVRSVGWHGPSDGFRRPPGCHPPRQFLPDRNRHISGVLGAGPV